MNELPVMEPPTVNKPKESIDTVPFALTLKIGTPDASDTENKSPVRSSVIENS